MSDSQLNGLHPWRTGYCDAIMGRECISPWAHKGWKCIRKNAEYVSGYLEGETAKDKIDGGLHA